ncbi:metallophosphoesterase family protein [Lacinutrix jangbogonensis]|uniref:metallophosphoesterase family protein n=1 Tax=Lacinutrix jangbogonensis TaxID=1469557 RepID=UPI00068D3CE0|nr:metallophosphoesterase [Lacinutrix jangbogonensis]
MIPSKPFIRSSSIAHSNWQSAVQKTIHDLALKEDSLINYNDAKVKFHTMMLGTNLHVNAYNKDILIDPLDKASIEARLPKDLDNDANIQSFLSQEFFLQASNKLKNNCKEEKKKTIDQVKKQVPLSILGFPFSDFTYEFWAISIINYYINHGFCGSTKHQQYNDWKIEGKNDINYGLIDYKLPENAKVVIVGDYGTGLPDAVAMLENIMTTINPDCIIHVGDVYYSGTEHECKTEILDVFLNVFKKVGKSVPLFSLPGNHEYMSGGQGFYKHVLDVNNKAGLPATTYQDASYFCLRSEDEKWQFLGMDTGYNSLPTPMPTIGPKLQESEVTWHKDKLKNFPGNTILLSHHQLFSVNALINEKTNGGSPYLNDNLYGYFKHYFHKIPAWFWGHEHSLGIYQDGAHKLSKGRLVGSSGFEEFTGEAPYKRHTTDCNVRYKKPLIKVGTTPVKWLEKSHDWFNHACAVINFSNVNAPEVKYYEFPVWIHKDAAPVAPTLTLIPEATENLITESFK